MNGVKVYYPSSTPKTVIMARKVWHYCYTNAEQVWYWCSSNLEFVGYVAVGFGALAATAYFVFRFLLEPTMGWVRLP